MRPSEGNLFKTCANPQAHNQKLRRANRYESEMVLTYRDLNCSGASPTSGSALEASNALNYWVWGSHLRAFPGESPNHTGGVARFWKSKSKETCKTEPGFFYLSKEIPNKQGKEGGASC